MATLKKWAQLGAAQRVAEITADLATIRSAFPGLGSRRRVQSDGGGGTLLHEPKKRQRKAMSPAQRRAVSGWMKKYWAARRKANA